MKEILRIIINFIVEHLPRDLGKIFAFQLGFSARNIWDMRKFYLKYKNEPNLRQLVAEIPWGHNILIMSKAKEPAAKEYYLKATLNMGWSRNVVIK
jgi:predicted nuclease of restriction endonuclease-like (RecB) superfamily